MATNPEPEVLYRDIMARGSLAKALQAVVEGGPTIPFTGSAPSPGDPLGSLGFATVTSRLPHRNALRISAWKWKRRWSIRGEESRGLALIEGDTDDLAAIARAAQAWHDGATLSDIRQAAAFVHLTGRFEVPDHDPVRLTESEWQYLRTEAREIIRESDQFSATYAALIEAAYAEPRIRALYPFTSHWTLRFSSTTHPRPTAVGPCLLAHSAGGYTISADIFGKDVLAHATTAEAAVSAAILHLPPGFGQVTAGTD